MEEIYRIADRITVLRDGCFVGTRAAVDLPRDEMIRWMVGREMNGFYTRHPAPLGDVVLEAKEMRLARGGGRAPRVDRVSFEVRAGEILGLAGLLGSGNSALLGSLFGRYGRRPSGRIRMKGREVRIRNPLDAIRNGMALLTNDRKESGLVMPMSVAQNVALPSLKKACCRGWLTRGRERDLAAPYRKGLDIRVPSLDSEVWTLSGGNQQKVILAKWLLTDPSVILLDEPTRGIDVAAKAEIYRLMDEWTARGKAVVLITSELPELLAMSDRILVMRQGRVSARFTREEATPEKVMAAAV
jgi:ABC-type sugar transport system ATPase subunit